MKAATKGAAANARTMPGGERFLSDDECGRITGLSKATRWRMAGRGEFPGKVRLSPGRTAYRLSEVEAWVASRAPDGYANLELGPRVYGPDL